MPIYEYECEWCDNKIEVLDRTIKCLQEDENVLQYKCKCKGMMRRVISAPSFVVHGANADNNYGLRTGGADDSDL